MFDVSLIAAAMNNSGIGMFSNAIVWCSPIQNSSKPSSSARITSSMSSSYACASGLAASWNGMMKMPDLILRIVGMSSV